MTVRPRRPEAADDLVEAVDLRRRQAGGRLVEDDEVRLPGQRAEDLDLLLLGERQPTDDRARLEVEAGVRGEPLEPLAHGPPVDEPGAPRLGAEEHVLRHGQPRDERDLLGDQRDPVDEGLAR